jgi:carboxypeptidase family protein
MTNRLPALRAVIFLFVALLLLFVPQNIFGQSATTGTIVGTVTDPSGAAIGGATAKLVDASTNDSRITVTNETGRYIFANVTPSKYSLVITKTGFRTERFSDQVVTVATTLTLNAIMEVGAITQTVEVTSTGSDLQTMNATVGNSVSGDLLQSLPSIGRDASTFVTLQPGVSPDGSVAGAVEDQSTFLLDGGQNTNDMDGSMAVYTPSFGGDPTGGIVSSNFGLGAPSGVMPTPLDSVEEFKVSTTNQTADFNTSAGAQVQIVTKRGTNDWHGSAYEYYLDNGLNANTWNNNNEGNPNPSYHYSRFGGSGGGPLVNKEFLGGKTYFFANYEGFRWNNSSTFETIVPSATLREGIIIQPNASGVNTEYNLATGTNCGANGTTACDPRGIGLNPAIATLWAKEPMGNETGGGGCGGFAGSALCDGLNEVGFRANLSIPYTSNFGVARLDHDFGPKWHFNTSYRYYKLERATTNQVDISGGTPVSLSNRPQVPWYYVAGLTTNITPNTTNDFHYSYLRNYWSWNDPGAAPQISSLGGALEPFGETASVLAPYNVNTQAVRTRFWDGQDNFFRDDVTILHGNHLFTFGGAYQRNFDYHQRSDNGGGINYQPVYQLGTYSAGAPTGGNVDFSSTLPAGANASAWGALSDVVLGIVSQSQIAYTRQGANLALNPQGTPAFDKSTIPYYNVYWSDSWHMKPSLTMTYGLGWTLEMPPTEQDGKQIELVDSAGQQIDVESYIKQRETAALAGQVYNPEIGFALVHNTGNGQKYPYQPFYGSFSPRFAMAWNPNYTDGVLGKLFGGNKTVVRGGYSRIYGRLNGVDLVLSPLLGDGLIQAVQCNYNLAPTTPGGSPTCGNSSSVLNPSTAFRVGIDGNNAPIPAPSATLPQPTFPGFNAVAAGPGEALDDHFRPNVVDSFDLTIQRQLSSKVLLEVGYIGRKITHEYQPININAVPYMMTLGGQTFAKAYAAIEVALGCNVSFAACGANGAPASLPAQPFFETALAGTGYCAGFANCTTAVANKEFGNLTTQSVWSLWSDLDNGGFNFPRTMLNTPVNCPTGAEIGCAGQDTSGVGVNASLGYGNYNAGFVSLKLTQWHNVTLQQNFTYSKALGTGAVVQASSEYTANDPFNLHNMYGVQNFDRKFVYNMYALLEDPYYKSQQGILGHILGGWTVAPILAIGSGAPVYCNTATDGQSFGSGDGSSFFDNEQCIFRGPHGNTTDSSLHANVGPAAYSIFANPAALLATVGPPILGLDQGTGGNGSVIRGLMYWNVDARITKNIKIWERVNLEFQMVTTNLFNHPIFNDPSLNPYYGVAYFGVVSNQGNNPRQMQFGLRLSF